MTLVYERKPNILQMYLRTKTEFSRSKLLKVRAQKALTYIETDTQTNVTESISTPHSRLMIIVHYLPSITHIAYKTKCNRTPESKLFFCSTRWAHPWVALD